VYIISSLHCSVLSQSSNLLAYILQGGVILVSHDERLIRLVCKELWIAANRTVKSIDGGIDEYRKLVEKELQL